MTDITPIHILSSEQKAAVLSVVLQFASPRPLGQSEAHTLLRDLELGHGKTARSYAEAEIERVLKKRLGLT